MMNDGKSYSIVSFYRGPVVDGSEILQCPLDYVPRVGERVALYSQRDEDGNYLNKEGQPNSARKRRCVIEGVVRAVHHLIEERGTTPSDRNFLQFVAIAIDSDVP